jgi:hypothetical protein
MREKKKKFEHIKNKHQFIKRANGIHEFKYNYSKVEFPQREPMKVKVGRRGGGTVEAFRKAPKYYRDAKIVIGCPKHGDFTQTARKHIEKNGSGCPTCALQTHTAALYGKTKTADYTAANPFEIEDGAIALKTTPSDGVERKVFLDKEDRDILSIGLWLVTGHQKSRRGRTEYCQMRRNNRIVVEGGYEWLGGHPKMHRLILSRMLGRPLQQKEYVDHIDGDGLNNRRRNLRLSTNAQNIRNTGKVRSMNGRAPSSQYKGVCFVSKTNKDGTDGSRYHSNIGSCDKNSPTKRRRLGLFEPTPEGEIAAAEAYDRAVVGLWEVVNPERQLNFPEKLEEYLKK